MNSSQGFRLYVTEGLAIFVVLRVLSCPHSPGLHSSKVVRISRVFETRNLVTATTLNRVFLKNLIVAQLVKILNAFHAIRLHIFVYIFKPKATTLHAFLVHQSELQPQLVR